MIVITEQANSNTPRYEVQNWLSDSEISSLEFSEYWNDEEQEKKKEVFWILDGNFEKMENYIQKEGFVGQLMECLSFCENSLEKKIGGRGADLAAGTLWAVPILFENCSIEKLYCVEYSHHRLLKIGPKVLDHYSVPKDKVVLALGSFYKLKLPDNSLDFVFMSAAFHHADDPDALLTEIRRVLKPDGVVIIIGEHVTEVTLTAYIMHTIRFFVSQTVPSSIQNRLFRRTFHVTKLIPKPDELFPPDPVLGDHYYTHSQYREMFSRHGFSVEHIKDDASNFQAFILAGNGSFKTGIVKK